MLNLKALSVAVIIGVLSPIVPINILSESYVLAQTTEEQKAEAASLYERGWSQLGRYESQQAIKSFQNALQIYSEIGDSSGQARTLRGLGWAYDEIGEFQKAIESYENSLFLFSKGRSTILEASTHNLLGYIYFQLGLFKKTIELNEKALSNLVNRDGDRVEYYRALFLADIGLSYFAMDQPKEAKQYSQKALDIIDHRGAIDLRAFILNDLGNIYQVLENTQKAIEYHKESIKISKEIGNRYWEVNALRDLGRAYQTFGNNQQALESYNQALWIAKEINYLAGQGQALSLIGDWLTQQEQPRLAVIYYKEAVRVYESIRANIQGLPIDKRKSYTNSVTDTYRNLSNLLLKENRVLKHNKSWIYSKFRN
jgi:tetratricopeptide (TPR) repeat protein